MQRIRDTIRDNFIFTYIPKENLAEDHVRIIEARKSHR